LTRHFHGSQVGPGWIRPTGHFARQECVPSPRWARPSDFSVVCFTRRRFLASCGLHSASKYSVTNVLPSASLSQQIRQSQTASSSEGWRSQGEEVSFTEYSPGANAEYWSTRPVTVIKRIIQVGSTLGGWIAKGRLRRREAIPAQRADSLRSILTDLGPAFIKIGQALSSRPDVLPPDFLREFEKLQDRLPPFPTEQALAVIASEMNRPVSDIFSSITESPVAAASLGQVYRATLRDSGDVVAVKVQRPGVKTAIALDVLVLRQLAVVIRQWRKLNTDLPALLDEWSTSLFRELDYRSEAENGRRFAELYSQLEGVYVPKMYVELCTSKVLVMEWVEGQRLRTAYSAVTVPDSSSLGNVSIGSVDDLRLVEVGVRCSLEQLLEYGFYHADPHPGNLLRTKDGKLAYLDFGMMGFVDENIRRGLIRATLHLVNREYANLADDFVTLGMLPKDSDKASIVPALTSVFAQALAGGVNNLSFGDLSANLGRTMYQFKFQIPPYYTLLVRSLSVLEGIALASDRNYKVLGAAYPWVARRLLTDTSPELRETLRSLLYKSDGKFNFKRLESLLTQASRVPSSMRGVYASSSMQRSKKDDAISILLAPEGDFIRAIVVEEVAKAIDSGARITADSLLNRSLSLLSFRYDAVFQNEWQDSGEHVFASADDVEQVEGVRRLLLAVQKITAAGQERAKNNDSKEEFAPTSKWGNTRPAFGSSIQGSDDDYAGNGGNGNGRDDERQKDSSAFCWERSISDFESAVSLLAWAATEVNALAVEERKEALRLPLEIAEAVTSRVVARAVRWFIVGDVLNDPPKGSQEQKRAGETAGV
jgi:aarF domain-containing kinase